MEGSLPHFVDTSAQPIVTYVPRRSREVITHPVHCLQIDRRLAVFQESHHRPLLGRRIQGCHRDLTLGPSESHARKAYRALLKKHSPEAADLPPKGQIAALHAHDEKLGMSERVWDGSFGGDSEGCRCAPSL